MSEIPIAAEDLISCGFGGCPAGTKPSRHRVEAAFRAPAAIRTGLKRRRSLENKADQAMIHFEDWIVSKRALIAKPSPTKLSTRR